MKPLSREWTDEDRIRVIAAILPGMSKDIYAGNYSAMGRPNITTLQHVIHDDAEVLEEYRAEFEKCVADEEKEHPAVDAEFPKPRWDR